MSEYDKHKQTHVQLHHDMYFQHFFKIKLCEEKLHCNLAYNRCRLKTNMDEINWSNDFYSDMFSLDFDSLFLIIDLESLEMKENCTVSEVENTTNQTLHFFIGPIIW